MFARPPVGDRGVIRDRPPKLGSHATIHGAPEAWGSEAHGSARPPRRRDALACICYPPPRAETRAAPPVPFFPPGSATLARAPTSPRSTGFCYCTKWGCTWGCASPNSIQISRANSNYHNPRWHISHCFGVKWERLRGAYVARRERGLGEREWCKALG